MKATRLSLVLIVVAAVCLAPLDGRAQSDRRLTSNSSRNADRKEPLLLRNLFGRLKAQQAPAPQAVSEPATGQLTQPETETLPASARAALAAVSVGVKPDLGAGSSPGASSPSQSVATAINKIKAQSNSEVVASASKALDGNKEELRTLARTVEGDRSKVVAEGKKWLKDPEVASTAREALEMVGRPESAEKKVTASSLEEMKRAASRAVSEGKHLLADNPDMAAQGKQLLKETKGMLGEDKVKDLKGAVPDLENKLNQIKATTVVPSAASIPAGPLPPWVDPKLPLMRDPVVEKIPRRDVQPAEMTKITAEFAKFDANTNVVTFEEDVELCHNQFDLKCQVLVAELKPGKEGAPPDPNMAKAQAAAGGIRKATAKGFVIIQKMSADGKVQVAKSREAVYDAETEDVILSDYPQLQDGPNLILGVENTTKIFLRKNGKYEVRGRHECEIVPEKGGLNSLKR